MSGTIRGYARVSTEPQDSGSDVQHYALEIAGCDSIVEEQASGRKAWPMLAEPG
ncbi:recombinase family protein [uncultured Sphingomonas sp.]|uniref:recombinase family protein n=1 Tax=uncultured Sphingomonas sp. TaxID=158754 RepID=UPI0035C97E71